MPLTSEQMAILLGKKPANKLTNKPPVASIAPAMPIRRPLTELINRKPVQHTLINDNTLRGTGMTKRLLEQTERQVEKDAKQAQFAKDTVIIGELDNIRMDLSESALDSSQIAAVLGTLKEQFACIIGSAGRGKTTVARTVINGWALAENDCYDNDLLFSNLTPNDDDIRFILGRDNAQSEIAIVSYTGRAVQNIQRALPDYLAHRCMTIHSLLEYAPTNEEYQILVEGTKDVYETSVRRVFRPRRTASNPLEIKYLIIDEGGMTPTRPLWEELIAALGKDFNEALCADCRIILLGDIQQLAPIHGRSVLGFAMLAWPTFELLHTHRTADGTNIVGAAEQILAGRVPKAEAAAGVHMVEISAGSMSAAREIKGIVHRLYKENRWDPLNDAIIVPTNKYELGQEQLNRDLVVRFNPPQFLDGDKTGPILNPRIQIQAGFERRVLAVGDKVMATQNNWDEGISNGMIGVIQSIVVNADYRGKTEHTGVYEHDGEFDLDDIEESLSAAMQDVDPSHPDSELEKKRQASHVVEIRFQNREDTVRFSTTGAVNSLNLGYAFTCHKAQGGEFNRVIVVVHASAKGMLTREWIYTAMTRAKKELIILFNQRGIQKGIGNQVIKGKTLEEKARQFIALAQNVEKAPYLFAQKTIGLPEPRV